MSDAMSSGEQSSGSMVRGFTSIRVASLRASGLAARKKVLKIMDSNFCSSKSENSLLKHYAAKEGFKLDIICDLENASGSMIRGFTSVRAASIRASGLAARKRALKRRNSNLCSAESRNYLLTHNATDDTFKLDNVCNQQSSHEDFVKMNESRYNNLQNAGTSMVRKPFAHDEVCDTKQADDCNNTIQRNLIKDLDEELIITSQKEKTDKEIENNVPDILDVDIDTQIAAIALVNLCYEGDANDDDLDNRNEGIQQLRKGFDKDEADQGANMVSCIYRKGAFLSDNRVLTRHSNRAKTGVDYQAELSVKQFKSVKRQLDEQVAENQSMKGKAGPTDGCRKSLRTASKMAEQTGDGKVLALGDSFNVDETCVTSSAGLRALLKCATPEHVLLKPTSKRTRRSLQLGCVSSVNPITNYRETADAAGSSVVKGRKGGKLLDKVEFCKSGAGKVLKLGNVNPGHIGELSTNMWNHPTRLRSRYQLHLTGQEAGDRGRSKRLKMDASNTSEHRSASESHLSASKAGRTPTCFFRVEEKSSGSQEGTVEVMAKHPKTEGGSGSRIPAESNVIVICLEASPEDKCRPPPSASTTPFGCLTPKNAASRVCMGDENDKQSCRRNLVKPSFAKETNSFIAPTLEQTLPVTESRKHRDKVSVRVLFSHNLDPHIIKQQKKILLGLGASEASSIADASHFVTDIFVRTRHLFEAIAFGKPVVTHLWLENCAQASCFIDEGNYILRDSRMENKCGFSLPVSLARACHNPILRGQRVLITPNTKPGKEMLASLVKAVHGLVVEILGRSLLSNKKLPDELLILSCEEDYEVCLPFLEKGSSVYSSELLLNGIVTQRLEYERHRLFADNVKRTLSTTWFKMNNNKRKASGRVQVSNWVRPPGRRQSQLKIVMRDTAAQFMNQQSQQLKLQTRRVLDRNKPTFWTVCPFCSVRYQYYKEVLNKILRCQSCEKGFIGYETKSSCLTTGTRQSKISQNKKDVHQSRFAPTKLSKLAMFSSKAADQGGLNPENLERDACLGISKEANWIKNCINGNIKSGNDRKRRNVSAKSCDNFETESTKANGEKMIVEEDGDNQPGQSSGCDADKNLQRSARFSQQVSYDENMTGADKVQDFAMRNTAAQFMNQQNQHSELQAKRVPEPNKPTFWTVCPFCSVRYQYYKEVLNKILRCQSCEKGFIGYETKSSSLTTGTRQSKVSQDKKDVHQSRFAPTKLSKLAMFSSKAADQGGLNPENLQRDACLGISKEANWIKNCINGNIKSGNDRKRRNVSAKSCDNFETESTKANGEKMIVEEDGDNQPGQSSGCDADKNLQRSARFSQQVSYDENMKCADEVQDFAMRNTAAQFMNQQNQHSELQAKRVPDPNKPTFWTVCPFCSVRYQYYKEVLNKILRCQSCEKGFIGYETKSSNLKTGTRQPKVSQDKKDVHQSRFAPTKLSKLAMFSSKAADQGGLNPENLQRDACLGISKEANWIKNCINRNIKSGNDRNKRNVSPKSCDSFETESTKENGEKMIVEEDGDNHPGQSSGCDADKNLQRSARFSQQVSYDENMTGDDELLKPTKRPKSSQLVSPGVVHLFEEDSIQKQAGLAADMTKKDKEAPSFEDNLKGRQTKIECSEKFPLSGDVKTSSSPGFFEYPDPDFNDFDELRWTGAFSPGQVWAVYDNLDGMPRFYALIKKVMSPGFRVRITWLEPVPDGEDKIKWVSAGLPTSCGKFKLGNTEDNEDHGMFSHLASWERPNGRNMFTVYPRKGEIWAIFKDWGLNWYSTLSDKKYYEFEFVEVLANYADDIGVRVAYLAKIKGFTCLFCRTMKEGRNFHVIPAEHIFRFSHKIPAFQMNEEDGESVLPGPFELDPASLPIRHDIIEVFQNSNMDTGEIMFNDSSSKSSADFRKVKHDLKRDKSPTQCAEPKEEFVSDASVSDFGLLGAKSGSKVFLADEVRPEGRASLEDSVGSEC